MTTIVLVDDAADIRKLVRARLQLSKAFDVVGEGSNGVDAIALAAQHRPDLLLLDVSMSGMDGLEAIPMVLTASPRTKVVMFSGFDEQGLSRTAIAMGASDFIQKSAPLADLADRLLAVASGKAPVLDTTPPAPVRTPGEGSDTLLDEHLERFRAAFDQAAIGMATMTLTGRIVRANTALERLSSAPPGGLVGSLFTDIVGDDHLNAVNGTIMRVASGVIDADNVSHGVVTPRGERWVVSTVAVVRDSFETPLYLFLQVQDVTDRRSAEEGLRLSEERFRLLVESVNDYAIFMLDPEGYITSWNPGAERIKGYRAEEVIGRHFELFYTDEARASRHPDVELSIARAEGRYEEEGWRIRKDGTRFWALVVITTIRDATGKLSGFAKVTRDITDRREILQDRERIAQERSEFLAVAAHELRGPVSLIGGFADMVNRHWRDLDDAERDDMTGTLVRVGHRLSRLVDDLFTASRLETGALEVVVEQVPLAPLLGAAVAEKSPGTTDMVVEVRCDADVRVAADPGRLQQMLGNYLTNALRYGEGPVVVSADQLGATVEIAVTDFGPGVPSELTDHLFEKFVHGTHEESTGLGLFIVRELARAQGGDATYERPPEGGTRFVIRLPAAGS